MNSIDLNKKPVATTFVGPSNVGKSTTAKWLEDNFGWVRFSSDEFIATVYLRDELIEHCGATEADFEDDKKWMPLMAQYIGQIGNPKLGGLEEDEFNKRQQKYFEAECASIDEMEKRLKQAEEEGKNFVFDSTGSLCGLPKKNKDVVRSKTQIIYIKPTDQKRSKIISDAKETPKPLCYPKGSEEDPGKPSLAGWLAGFMQDKKQPSSVQEVEPNQFYSWVVPKLIDSRLEEYEKFASSGNTVLSSALENIDTEAGFLSVAGLNANIIGMVGAGSSAQKSPERTSVDTGYAPGL